MFGRKTWKNQILIEGQTQATLVSRINQLPEVNPEYDHYPVDVTLPGKRTFKEAVKLLMEYSKHNIYSQIYKITGKEPKG